MPVRCARDIHLFSPGKKRILALDGGGVRGALSIAFLERLEEVLCERSGAPVRLCDYFDLIGGTSTGAIITGGLVLGYSAREIRDFYLRLAPNVFKAPHFNIPGWRARFDAARLHAELKDAFRGYLLGAEELQTGLCVVTKRMDTGSCWIVMNNPRSAFWETPADEDFIGNRHLSLANLIRASAAAPFYFDPEIIEIVKGAPPGLFLDGGLTPHNNPSLALYLAAMLPPHGLCWRSGPNDLFIMSIGTGAYRTTLDAKEAHSSLALSLAVKALAAQAHDGEDLTLMMMAWLGRSIIPWPLNSELGDLGATAPPFGEQFRFLRCNAQLEAKWLKEALSREISMEHAEKLRRLDDPANVEELYEIGRDAAEQQITREALEGW
jgi:uncharacterized protein